MVFIGSLPLARVTPVKSWKTLFVIFFLDIAQKFQLPNAPVDMAQTSRFFTGFILGPAKAL